MDFDDFAPPAPEPPPPAPERRAPRPQPDVELPPFEAGSALSARPVAAPPAPVAARAKAGLGVLAAAAGAGVGGVLGGPFGAAAGLAGVGALRNLYRSQAIASSDPVERNDAARSIALCLVGGAIAAYLGYKAFSAKESR